MNSLAELFLMGAVTHIRCARDELIATRLQDEQRERISALLREAEQRLLTAQQEAQGRYVVRDPAQPGVCQLTTADCCTCPGFEIWRRCEHVALVRKAEGLI